MIRWLAVVVTVLSLSSPPFASAQGVSEGAGQIEQLLGLMVDAEGVTFQVHTGGCTQPQHFRVERFGRAPIQLLLIRTIADRCEAFVPYGTTLKVSYSQLRLADRESFVVVNPIASGQVVSQP